MANDTWNKIRREAEITCTEYADFVGIRRDYAQKMETGRIIPTKSDFSALLAMVEVKSK